MTFKKFIILAIIAFVGWIFWIKFSISENEENWKKETPLFQNNIVVKGVIDSLSDSGDHCFGIIYLKKFHSNIPKFNPFKKNIFPYAIKPDRCEIYSNICLNALSKGDSIILNSNKRKVHIIAKDSDFTGNYSLDFVNSHRRYIKENSKLSFK